MRKSWTKNILRKLIYSKMQIYALTRLFQNSVKVITCTRFWKKKFTSKQHLPAAIKNTNRIQTRPSNPAIHIRKPTKRGCAISRYSNLKPIERESLDSHPCLPLKKKNVVKRESEE